MRLERGFNWMIFRIAFALPLFAVIFLTACKSKVKSQPKSQLQLLAFYAQDESPASDTLLISTQLFNNSDTVFYYHTMSCEKSIDYTTSNRDISIKPFLCEKNIPEIDSVLPHKSVEQLITLVNKSGRRFQDRSLKIGFCIFKDDQAMISQDTARRHVIWSGEIFNQIRD